MKNLKKSSQQGQLVAVIVVSVLAAILIIGLSLKKRPKVVTMQAVADQAKPVDTLISQQEVRDYPPEIEGVFHRAGRLAVYAGNKLYALGHDETGWLDPATMDFDTQKLQLKFVLFNKGQLIIGGDGLLIAGEDDLEIHSEYDFGSSVNVIIPFGEGYLVGTDHNLHFYTQGKEATIFKEDILVTALSEDVGGLWVGTFGDGLWRFDGEKWQRRYLIRDNSIFDFVNALAFNYPYLWVGTPSGIFRYNGGTWKQLFVSDSSEVYEVNCFLPLVFRTYIGTQQGLFIFANDSLKAVPDFENMQVVGLFKDGGDILVATRNSGIFKLKGKEEILRPEQLLIIRHILAEVE